VASPHRRPREDTGRLRAGQGGGLDHHHRHPGRPLDPIRQGRGSTG
jgi:hypothetical protein